VQYLGRVLPPAVMAALIIYCVRNIEFTAAGGFLPQLIAVLIVALLHIWKRNNLLSILGGTACYMLMIQLGLF
jgi:branched-subunit amino acid transport protein AzlD